MNQFDLLKEGRFAPLFITQFLGALNDNVFKNALVILIAFSLADLTEANSSILVIIAAGLFILPFFLFSAIAGQLADKYEKSILIRRIKIAEICIMVLATASFLSANLYLLMVVLFLMGTQSTLFGPLKYGILPQHLSESELTGGNGLIQMGTYLAILLGTILGGILIAVSPGGEWYVSLVVLLVATAGWLASRRIPHAPPADPAFQIRWNIARETMRILVYARENRSVFWSVLAISWFWFYGATFLSLIPSYTRDILAGNEHVTTLLLTAFSVGIGSGSLMCEKFSKGTIEVGLVLPGAAGLSLFALDLFYVGMPGGVDSAGTPVLTAGLFLQDAVNWRVLADLTLIGFFGGLYIVPLYALVQNRSAPGRRSRIIAANNILNALFMVVSALMTIGLISAGVSITGIFLIVAILNAGIALLVCFLLPEFYRHAISLFSYRRTG